MSDIDPNNCPDGCNPELREALPVVEVSQAEWEATSRYPINFAPVFDEPYPPNPHPIESPRTDRLRKTAAFTLSLLLSAAILYPSTNAKTSVPTTSCGLGDRATENGTVTYPPVTEDLEQLLFNNTDEINPILLERLDDRNTDPAYRAASLTLLGYQAPDVPVFGSGGLVEYRGDLYIGTVKHVSDAFQGPLIDAPQYVHIPGVGFMEFAMNSKPLYLKSSKGHTDPAVYWQLPNHQQKTLQGPINEGVIMPLTVKTLERKSGEQLYVADPKSGTYTAVSYRDFEGQTNDLTLKDGDLFTVACLEGSEIDPEEVVNESELEKMASQLSPENVLEDGICGGQSGTPLVTDNNEVVAFVSSGRLTLGMASKGSLTCHSEIIASSVG